MEVDSTHGGMEAIGLYYSSVRISGPPMIYHGFSGGPRDASLKYCVAGPCSVHASVSSNGNSVHALSFPRGFS